MKTSLIPRTTFQTSRKSLSKKSLKKTKKHTDFTVIVNPLQNATESFDLDSIINNFFQSTSIEDYLTAHAPTIYGLPFPIQEMMETIVREINFSILIDEWRQIEDESSLLSKSQIFWENTFFTKIDDTFLAEETGVVGNVEKKVALFSFEKMWKAVVDKVDPIKKTEQSQKSAYEMPNPYDGFAFSTFCQVIQKRSTWWKKFKNVTSSEVLKVEAENAINYLATIFVRVRPLSWAIIKFFVSGLFQRSKNYTLERKNLSTTLNSGTTLNDKGINLSTPLNDKWTNSYEVWQVGLTSVFSANPFTMTHLMGASSLYVLYNKKRGLPQEVILMGSEATGTCPFTNLVHPTTMSALGWISNIQKKYAYDFWDILYPEEKFSKSVTLKTKMPDGKSFAAWQEFRNHKRTKANSRNFELNFDFKDLSIPQVFQDVYTILNTIFIKNLNMNTIDFNSISVSVNALRTPTQTFNFDVWKSTIRGGWEAYKTKKRKEEGEREGQKKTQDLVLIGEEETFKNQPLKGVIFDFSNFKSSKEKPDKFLEFLNLKTKGSYFSSIFKKKRKHKEYFEIMIQFLVEFFTPKNQNIASISTWTSLVYLFEQFLSPFFNFSVLYALLFSPEQRLDAVSKSVEETDFPWVNRNTIPTNIIIWTSSKHATLVHAFLKNNMGFESDEEKTYAKAIGTAIASVWSAKTLISDVCLDIARQGVDLQKLQKFIEDRVSVPA